VPPTSVYIRQLAAALGCSAGSRGSPDATEHGYAPWQRVLRSQPSYTPQWPVCVSQRPPSYSALQVVCWDTISPAGTDGNGASKNDTAELHRSCGQHLSGGLQRANTGENRAALLSRAGGRSKVASSR